MCFPCMFVRCMYVRITVCATFNFPVFSWFSMHCISGILRKRYLCRMKGKMSLFSGPSSKLVWEGRISYATESWHVLVSMCFQKHGVRWLCYMNPTFSSSSEIFFCFVSQIDSINRCMKKFRSAYNGGDTALELKGAEFEFCNFHLLIVGP